jgi:putative transposase
VKVNQAHYPIATMCRVLEVSTSGYYAWLQRPPSRRAREDQALTQKIRTIHARSKGTYGAPRIHAKLPTQGWQVGRKRVARLMRADGLQGVSRRKGPRTTRRQPGARPAPDLVNRNFSAQAPDRLWVADLTYIATWTGWLYLAVVEDAWSRRVVGWAMATHLRTELVLDALSMAIQQRRPNGVIHHSDQGSQYTSLAFGKRCREAGLRPSMGSVGDCFDNALCESFFATLECELLDRETFRTQAEARLAVFQFIEGWYNPHRLHKPGIRMYNQNKRSVSGIIEHLLDKSRMETTHGWSTHRIYYLACGLYFGAVVLRSLLIYQNDVLLPVIAGLLAAWLALFTSQPFISRRWPPYFPVLHDFPNGAGGSAPAAPPHF